MKQNTVFQPHPSFVRYLVWDDRSSISVLINYASLHLILKTKNVFAESSLCPHMLLTSFMGTSFSWTTYNNNIYVESKNTQRILRVTYMKLPWELKKKQLFSQTRDTFVLVVLGSMCWNCNIFILELSWILGFLRFPSN